MSRILPRLAVLAPLCLILNGAFALPANFPADATNTSVASSTAVTAPYIERVEPIASNGNGGAGITNHWGGHQSRITHHRDGTVRVLYLINNPSGGLYWSVMRRSAGATASWTQEASGTSYDDVVLLRDPVSDRAHVVAWPNSVPTVYTSPSYTQSAIPGSWQILGPGSRHYTGAGIGPDGTVCLKVSVELTTSVPTSNTNTVYRCGKHNASTGAWAWNPQTTKWIGLRHAYDYVFPGGFGVAGEMVATSQSDLYKTAAGLPNLSFPYAFNGVRFYATGASSTTGWKQANSVNGIAAPTSTTVAPTARQLDSFIDGANRVWNTYYVNDPQNIVPRGLYLSVTSSSGAVLYQRKLPVPVYGYARLFEDAKGRRWLLWMNQGSQSTQTVLYRVNVSGTTSLSVSLGSAVDLTNALKPYSLQGAPMLALPRGGQSVGNVVDASFAACEGTYVTGQALKCSPSGTGQQRIVHFRIRLPD